MFGYLLANWRFKRAFTPDGDAFLYRKNPRAPAYRVSPDERTSFVRTFKRQYWKYHLALWGVLLAAASFDVFLMLYVGIPEKGAAALGYGIVAILFVAFWLIDRRLYSQPMQALASREAVLPARSWRQANAERMTSMSWPTLIIVSLILVAFAWITVPRGDFGIWWPVLWILYFGGAGFNWGRAMLRKYKAARAP